MKYGFSNDDFLVLIVGSSTFYNEPAWDYAVAMHTIGPLLIKYARRKDPGGAFKFVFLCGNSTDGYNEVLQVIHCKLRIRTYAVAENFDSGACTIHAKSGRWLFP